MGRIASTGRSSGWPPRSWSRSADSGRCRKRSPGRYRLGDDARARVSAARSKERGGTLDANRLSQGQLVAAVSAIALFIISFLPWFGLSGFGGSANRDMWEFENPLDIYLLIVILVALVPAAATFLGG